MQMVIDRMGVLRIAVLALLAYEEATAANPTVTVFVDAAAKRQPINPLIYGVNWATTEQLDELNSPLNRQGGNATSRYNWQLNASNRGRDWYFQSTPIPDSTPGEFADSFIADTRAAGAESMLTIPLLNWIAKLGPNRSKLASFSITKYGPQTGNDARWFPDAGNGISTNGGFITGNDANDANVRVDSGYQRSWVQHLVSTWGTAQCCGLRYYILDNEPSLWHSTHRDVHPVGATMAEVRDRIINYASMIKNVDPGALVVAPEEWGWTGYFRSGYDKQWGDTRGWSGPMPDQSSHGGWAYLPWLLDQLRREHERTGRRLLDVFSVHFYPQGGESSADTSVDKQLLRNRSTRSLWDPNYRDESWINDHVALIPRLRNWIDSYYPDTALAITEYDWGAEHHISGALAQADVLGLFGREGVDMAARWEAPAIGTPVYNAMKLYRNYDGNKSTFGDISVSAVGPNRDNVAAFAAERSADDALTVIVINKYLQDQTPVIVALRNFSAGGTAQRWQLTAANEIERLSDVGVSSNRLFVRVPPQSITLFIVARAPAATPAVLDFGNVTLGDSRDMPLSVSNTSASTLTGTVAVNAPFEVVSGSPFSIPSGQTATVTIRFRPLEATAIGSQATVSGGGGTRAIPLSGAGVGR